MKKAYIALTTVLIIVPILVLAGITLLQNNMDLLEINSYQLKNTTLQVYANSCLEEGLLRIRANSALTGTYNITYKDCTCVTTIENSTTTGVKIINIKTSGNNATYNLRKVIDTRTNPLTVSN